MVVCFELVTETYCSLNSMSLYKRQYPKQVEYFVPPAAGKHVGEVAEEQDDDQMDVE